MHSTPYMNQIASHTEASHFFINNNSGITIKTIHALEAELLRLKESSGQALQQSKEEVDTLVQQCDAHIAIRRQLREDFKRAREKERYWRERFLDEEFKLIKSDKESFYKKLSKYDIQCPISHTVLAVSSTSMCVEGGTIEPKYNFLESKSMETFNNTNGAALPEKEENNQQSPKKKSLQQAIEPNKAKRRYSVTNLGSALRQVSTKKQELKQKSATCPSSARSKSLNDVPTNLLKSSLVQTKERKEDQDDKTLEQQYAKMEFELEVKMAYRDYVIRYLEETTGGHERVIHDMEAEMECIEKTLKTKEEKDRAAHLQDVYFFEEKISILQHKIKDKDKVIVSQRGKMDEYETYIEELAAGLRTVLRLLKQAERNGVDLNVLR